MPGTTTTTTNDDDDEDYIISLNPDSELNVALGSPTSAAAAATVAPK